MSLHEHTAKPPLFASEVAARLRCSERAVMELHRKRVLPAVPKLRPLRWPSQRVEEFLNKVEV